MSGALEKLPEPDKGFILVSSVAYNRLLKAVNAIILLQIAPQGIGSLKVGDENAVLDLGPLESAQIVARVVAVEKTIAGILASLRAIQGSATCNDDGTVTFAIKVPDLPAK